MRVIERSIALLYSFYRKKDGFLYQAFLQIFSGNCRRRWRKLQLVMKSITVHAGPLLTI